MKRKISWFCAAAVGMSALPVTAVNAADATPTPTVPTVATANQAAVTPAPAQTEALIPATPPDAAAQVGQVLPGVTGANAPIVAENIPSRDVKLNFAQIAPPPGSMVLRGVNPTGSVEFGMRSDEVVSKALLNLEYTPSPALLPVQSQLKVYLNDELMGVLPVTKEQLGKKTFAQVPINPLYITDFNRVRLEFVGHYRDICENPASTTLWMDVGRSSSLALTYQRLEVQNDLSHFPIPFFDPRDDRPLTLPFVFAASPDIEQQRAAGIVASWFGSRTAWRGQSFPVLYNQLPDSNGIVFATNDKRPDFLRDHPPVKAPTVEMINHPGNPYIKLLVVFGRDDKDLIQAAKGIAQGNILFRSSSVTVDDVKPLLPRQPYDAPNWVRTDRPITLGELKTYQEQLQSSGLEPAAINITMNLPPDLYLLRSNGIDLNLKYRYTAPAMKDSSRMDISLNNQFLQSFNLTPNEENNKLLLRLPVLQGLLDGKTDVAIPALRLGAANQLRFDFSYMNPMPGGSIENCITFQPVQNHVVVEDESTIDFSNYHHFIAMPDLRSFANAGFPFSRMADLSQTIVVVGKTPEPAQMTALLDTLGTLGSQTGLPALNVDLTDDGSAIQGKDADIMIIGSIPPGLKDDKRIDLLVEAAQSWVKTPVRQSPLLSAVSDPNDRVADIQTTVSSAGPMAAIVGFQSPYNDQRSVLALLADSPRGYELLNGALNDSGKRAAISGSVAVIRESGVNSLRVGDIYYVGHLPWFERIWYALSNHPVLLAIFAAISVVLLAWVLWRVLRILSRRRIDPEDE
ncbi:cellulose biosynthesis cyclic di-GMP-binding regulatory protein BcsB [Cedecea davisae]|uniref:Cyclic di-GMP-binding protein n=1 Tax=Cedecea davisae DSM 4568 TaxID=566551 RepID=S3IGG6_9ENTR|nr:cellulose biosynthesis cyclic di-GMP-binding regulatory protein BcsB [Cedecea davisae]EPF12958.1 bacterial cellulose synthase subunit [Cedecea davisae DSM 4568]